MLPLSHTAVSEVVVWVLPVLVHRTVVPTPIVTVGGVNMKLLMFTSTVVPAGTHVAVAPLVGLDTDVAVRVGVEEGSMEVLVAVAGVPVAQAGLEKVRT